MLVWKIVIEVLFTVLAFSISCQVIWMLAFVATSLELFAGLVLVTVGDWLSNITQNGVDAAKPYEAFTLFVALSVIQTFTERLSSQAFRPLQAVWLIVPLLPPPMNNSKLKLPGPMLLFAAETFDGTFVVLWAVLFEEALYSVILSFQLPAFGWPAVKLR